MRTFVFRSGLESQFLVHQGMPAMLGGNLPIAQTWMRIVPRFALGSQQGRGGCVSSSRAIHSRIASSHRLRSADFLDLDRSGATGGSRVERPIPRTVSLERRQGNGLGEPICAASSAERFRASIPRRTTSSRTLLILARYKDTEALNWPKAPRHSFSSLWTSGRRSRR